MLIGDLLGERPDQGLVIMCRLCGHRAFWSAPDACAAFGETTSLGSVAGRVRCKACGHKGSRHFAAAASSKLEATSPFLALAGRPQVLRCHMCWFEELVAVEDILKRFGAEATFQLVRTNGRCAKCGVAGYLRVGDQIRPLTSDGPARPTS